MRFCAWHHPSSSPPQSLAAFSTRAFRRMPFIGTSGMPFTEKSPMTDPWDYMDYSPSHEVGEKMAFNEQGGNGCRVNIPYTYMDPLGQGLPFHHLRNFRKKMGSKPKTSPRDNTYLSSLGARCSPCNGWFLYYLMVDPVHEWMILMGYHDHFG